MKLTIKGAPNEIAALVLAVQERREECLTVGGKVLARQVSHEISRQGKEVQGTR